MSPERKPSSGHKLPKEWWVVIGERAHRDGSYYVEWFRTEAGAREKFLNLRAWGDAYRSVVIKHVSFTDEEVVEQWQRDN
jgi:hypothetical protein